MKKTLVLLIAAMTAAVATVSCKKESQEVTPDVQPTEKVELAAPVLSISPEDMIVLEEETTLTLSWTSAVPEDTDIYVSYRLYANDARKEMYTSPLTFEAGHELAITLKASDLVGFVEKMDSKDPELQFAIYAKPADENIEATSSNTVKIKVSIAKEEQEIPETLYLVGSATAAGWDASKAIPVTGKDKVYTAEDIELNLTITDTGFKFLFANDGSSSCFFGQDLSSESFGAVKFFAEDDGSVNLFQPALNGFSSGVYTIVLNLNSYMMTLTRTGDIEHKVQLGTNVYPLGDCFDWKWRFESPMPKTDENVYEMKNVHINVGDGNNGFKIFTEVDKWSPYFAQADGSSKGNIEIQLVTDSEIPQFKPGLLGYESGTYDIKADFNTMTLTLTLISKDDKPGLDEETAFYIYGGGFEDGVNDWSFDVRHALAETPDGSGIYVTPQAVYLNQWCYFKFVKKDWTEYVRDDNASDYWTATIRTKDPDNDCTFSPGNGFPAWTDGNYIVTFDTNTGKVSVVKAE